MTIVVVVVYSMPSISKVMHKSYERVDDVVSKLISTQTHLEPGRLGILYYPVGVESGGGDVVYA